MSNNDKVIILILMIIAAVFLDWLWYRYLKNREKKARLKASLPAADQESGKRKIVVLDWLYSYRRHPWIAVPLILIAAFLAYLAQKGLLGDHVKEPGIWYLLVSGVLFALASLVVDFPSPA